MSEIDGEMRAKFNVELQKSFTMTTVGTLILCTKLFANSVAINTRIPVITVLQVTKLDAYTATMN